MQNNQNLEFMKYDVSNLTIIKTPEKSRGFGDILEDIKTNRIEEEKLLKELKALFLK